MVKGCVGGIVGGGVGSGISALGNIFIGVFISGGGCFGERKVDGGGIGRFLVLLSVSTVLERSVAV